MKYYIKPGVKFIDGKKVKPNQNEIELNEVNALYDLGLGRISKEPFKKNSQNNNETSSSLKIEDKKVEQTSKNQGK